VGLAGERAEVRRWLRPRESAARPTYLPIYQAEIDFRSLIAAIQYI
jgi:hypothetical protein